MSGVKVGEVRVGGGAYDKVWDVISWVGDLGKSDFCLEQEWDIKCHEMGKRRGQNQVSKQENQVSETIDCEKENKSQQK